MPKVALDLLKGHDPQIEEAKMSQNTDDLEAVRTIASTLEPFEKGDRERMIRWVREKLGMDVLTLLPSPQSTASPQSSPEIRRTGPTVDVRSFVNTKNPKADAHFAATIAFYYKFESSEADRKPTINSSDLQEACRLAGRQRLHDPGHTLRDARKIGLLDKGPERGTYSISTVGENLVAMTLPTDRGRVSTTRTKPGRANRRKSTVKK